MALRIIIDGYNLIRQSPALRSYDKQDIARGREKLIALLASYRTLKHYPMMVVFDGWQDGAVTEHHSREKGIEIIFSRRGEKADEVIKRLVSRQSGELMVVTSDREITHFCKSRRCEVVPSPAFAEKLECAFLFSTKGASEDDEKPFTALSTKKKGPSKKLPKARRKLEQRLKKL